MFKVNSSHAMADMTDYEPYVTQGLIDRGHARRMGHLENYFAMMQRQKMYTNFSIYTELSEPVSWSQIGRSLRKLFLRHPILIHTIVPKRTPEHESFYLSEEYLSKPYPQHDYIRVLDDVKFRDLILNWQPEYRGIVDRLMVQYTQDDYKISGKFSEILSTLVIPIADPERPNWRLMILPSQCDGNERDITQKSVSKILYISNHCCADALTGINLLQDMCSHINDTENLSDVEENGEIESWVLVDYAKDSNEMYKIELPITDRLDYRPPLTSLPKIMLSTMVKDRLTYRSSGMRTKRCDELNEPLTYDYVFNIGKDELNMIRSQIKERATHMGTTITPYLQACWLLALQRTANLFKYNWLEWGTDVTLPSSTRKLLPFFSEDSELAESYKYGSNVGGLHYFYWISKLRIADDERDKFWMLVNEYDGYFRDAWAKGDHFSGLGTLMLDVVTQKQNIDKMITDAYLNQSRGGTVLSNAGFFPQLRDHQDGVHLCDLIFSQTPGALKFAFGVNIASTDVNGMNVSLSMVRGTLRSREEWHALCREYRRIIDHFCGMK